MAANVNFQLNQQAIPQANQNSTWSNQAIANTILKTAALTTAAILYLGNQTAQPNTAAEKIINFVKTNSETISKICLVSAFAPEGYIAGKFAFYDRPEIGASIISVGLGLLIQKHLNLV
jgi:hypothetical protein